MKTFQELIEATLPHITEIFPWDLEEMIEKNDELLLIDLTEPTEFNKLHLKNALNVPRGILESACEWNFTDTLPALARARDQKVILICRSGNRSALAAYAMQSLGFTDVASLKTGLRGWNDYELPLYDIDNNQADVDDADDYFSTEPRPDQMAP